MGFSKKAGSFLIPSLVINRFSCFRNFTFRN